VGLVRASTVEDQLVLGVADVDALLVACAGVGAWVRAGRRCAGALRLGGGHAVRDGSDVGACATGRARSDSLGVVSVQICSSHTRTFFFNCCNWMIAYHEMASDIALHDGKTILGADVLAEGALRVRWDSHGRSGEGEDGGEELHFDLCVWKQKAPWI
jgi:hypothetical protein